MNKDRFTCLPAPLDGLFVVERTWIGDERGFLSRLFCAEDLAPIGFTDPIVQINHARTQKAGTVRGMHYQRLPNAEAKFVSCVRGAILDVAVDLRHGSSTFLRWHAVELSETNRRSLFIPKGFAHGFQTLVDGCELLYLHTADYSPSDEGAVNALDPRLGIAWPLPITIMSERDRGHAPIGPDFTGVQTSP